MPEVVSEWPVIRRRVRPDRRAYPLEWWDGEIRVLRRGELPWWPVHRKIGQLRTSMARSARNDGHYLESHQVGDDVLTFRATPYLEA